MKTPHDRSRWHCGARWLCVRWGLGAEHTSLECVGRTWHTRAHILTGWIVDTAISVIPGICMFVGSICLLMYVYMYSIHASIDTFTCILCECVCARVHFSAAQWAIDNLQTICKYHREHSTWKSPWPASSKLTFQGINFLSQQILSTFRTEGEGAK